jgi:hypothetical protein
MAKPLLKPGFSMVDGEILPTRLAREKRRRKTRPDIIGTCACGDPAFVRLGERVACIECAQKAINCAQPYMQAEEDMNEFIEEGGKPS